MVKLHSPVTFDHRLQPCMRELMTFSGLRIRKMNRPPGKRFASSGILREFAGVFSTSLSGARLYRKLRGRWKSLRGRSFNNDVSLKSSLLCAARKKSLLIRSLSSAEGLATTLSPRSSCCGK